MMCSSILVDDTCEDYRKDPLSDRLIEDVTVKKELCCCECKEGIQPGDLHEKRVVGWKEGEEKETYLTCSDCLSIRAEFFCNGFVYNEMYKLLGEHIVDFDGQVSEECLVRLTSAARAKVLDLVEENWKLEEDVM